MARPAPLRSCLPGTRVRPSGERYGYPPAPGGYEYPYPSRTSPPAGLLVLVLYSYDYCAVLYSHEYSTVPVLLRTRRLRVVYVGLPSLVITGHSTVPVLIVTLGKCTVPVLLLVPYCSCTCAGRSRTSTRTSTVADHSSYSYSTSTGAGALLRNCYLLWNWSCRLAVS